MKVGGQAVLGRHSRLQLLGSQNDMARSDLIVGKQLREQMLWKNDTDLDSASK